MLERYVYKNQKKLRCGYTTGTCACAAAKAAAQMLLSGKDVLEVNVETPMGVHLQLPVEKIVRGAESVSCAIKKDSGDDPDVTNGIYIYAEVSYVIGSKACNSHIDNNKCDAHNSADEISENNINADAVSADEISKNKINADAISADVTGKNNISADAVSVNEISKNVIIDGGIGIGRITKKGLQRPIGEAAINPVPLKMIADGVRDIADRYSYEGILKVVISAPEGVEIAKKTFNPQLGIVGGISILGTTGIVEPMSEQAIIDTIRTEINMHMADGERTLLIAPGNYGQDFLLNNLNIELKRSIKCSNYIGDTIDMVCDAGAESMLLVGNIGKLVKLGAGIMNTHSRVADGRMEVLSACAIQAGAEADIARKILDCVTTDAALEILKESDMLEGAMEQLMIRIEKVLKHRSSERIRIGAIVFSNEYGILGKTKLADELVKSITD